MFLTEPSFRRSRELQGSGKPDPPETVRAGSALPTLCLPHAGQQGSSPADVVLPFLELPQATVATEATPGA